MAGINSTLKRGWVNNQQESTPFFEGKGNTLEWEKLLLKTKRPGLNYIKRPASYETTGAAKAYLNFLEEMEPLMIHLTGPLLIFGIYLLAITRKPCYLWSLVKDFCRIESWKDGSLWIGFLKDGIKESLGERSWVPQQYFIPSQNNPKATLPTLPLVYNWERALDQHRWQRFGVNRNAAIAKMVWYVAREWLFGIRTRGICRDLRINREH